MNADQLASFANYCYRYPEQRFWQALRNWAGVRAVLVTDSNLTRDTYYLKDNEGLAK